MNTSYGRLPGGGYGYGYYDPLHPGVFMAVAAHQMMVNDAMMMNSGYGHWDNRGRPVVVHSNGALIVYFVLMGIIVVVVVVVMVINKKQ